MCNLYMYTVNILLLRLVVCSTKSTQFKTFAIQILTLSILGFFGSFHNLQKSSQNLADIAPNGADSILNKT